MKNSAVIKMTVGLLSVFFLLFTFSLVINYYMIRRSAIINAEEKAELLTGLYSAIHRYFTDELKPDLFRKVNEGSMPGEFDPVWMSSSYVVTRIQNYFSEQGAQGFLYKHVAVNARNPFREANEEEASFLTEVNADPTVQKKSFFRKEDGEIYYYMFRKGELLEESCMICHGSPEEAPRGLVEIYGRERGFHKQPGRTVSVEVFRIPVTDIMKNDSRTFLLISLLLLVMTVLGIVTVYLINKRFILYPLDHLADTIDTIAQNRELLSREINRGTYSTELRPLVTAFNFMNHRLWEYETSLEDKVRKRTDELKNSVDTMKTLLSEIHHRVKNNLQFISSYVSVRKSETDNPEMKEILDEINSKIEVISLVHGMLYKSYRNEILPLKDYLDNLIKNIAEYLIPDRNLHVNRTIDTDLFVNDKQGQTFGLIITELLTNAIKYCDRSADNPEISIDLHSEGQTIQLTVRNPAVSVPGFSGRGDSLGIKIIKSFLSQWNGTLKASLDQGVFTTVIMVVLPESSDETTNGSPNA